MTRLFRCRNFAESFLACTTTGIARTAGSVVAVVMLLTAILIGADRHRSAASAGNMHSFGLSTLIGNVVCDPATATINASTPNAKRSIAVKYMGGASAKVYGFSVHFAFDKTVVSTAPASVTQGDLFSGTTSFLKDWAEDKDDEIIVDWVLTGQSATGVDGPGTLFTVEVTGIANGSSPIQFLGIDFRDKDNNPLTQVIGEDGVVLVDLTVPTVSSVAIDNATNTWTDDYTKNGDDLVLTATVGDTPNTLAASNIVADLSALLSGGNAARAADTYTGGVATWTLTGVTLAADGSHSVQVSATDALGNTGTGSDAIIADNTKPTGATNLVAHPLHQKVRLEWTAGTDAVAYRGVVLRYAEWGGAAYPTYPTASAPDYPTSTTGSLIAPVSTVLDPATTIDHEITARNAYYYSVFAQDMAGNLQETLPSTAKDRSTNYYLGDLGSGTGVLPGSGYNGLVNFDDLLFLTGLYRKKHAQWTGTNAEADFGPSVSHKSLGKRFGIPTPDGKIDFEDLMLLALNYNSVPKSPLLTGERASEIALEARVEQQGDDLLVTVYLANDGRPVKGVSAVLCYDPAQLAVKEAKAGSLFGAEQPYAFFRATPEDGCLILDGALIGRSCAASGSGDVAVIRFEDYTRGGVGVEFGAVTVRDVENEEIPVRIRTASVASGTPLAFGLSQNYPNPFSTRTEIRYQLPERASVTLAICTLLGERVAVLAAGEHEAGYHHAVWDRRDATGRVLPNGVYLCVLRVGTFSALQTVTLMK